MPRYKGNIITVTTIATAGTKNSTASGRWSITDVLQLRANSAWPLAATVPGAPTIGTAVSVSTTSVAVPFTASSDTGGLAITGYTVTSSGGQSATGASSPIIVTGLTTGTSYTFTVTATNSLGTSVSSEVSNSLLPLVLDPYFSSVSLLMNGNTLTDISSSPKTITNNGGVSINTSIKKYGTGSMYFNNNYLTLPEIILDSDFTVEFWVYRLSEDYQIILSGANDTQIDIGSPSGGVSAFVFTGTTGSLIGSSGKVGLNVWKHIAITRSGNTAYIFIDGVLDVSNTFSSSALVKISNISKYGVGAGYFLYGYLDDLRITKGIARYTSNFTPPTSQFPTQ